MIFKKVKYKVMNKVENIALSKLSYHISLFKLFKWEDINFIARTFGINKGSSESPILHEGIEYSFNYTYLTTVKKSELKGTELLNFLGYVYTTNQEKFIKSLEEILRRLFVKAASNTENNYGNIFDIFDINSEKKNIEIDSNTNSLPPIPDMSEIVSEGTKSEFLTIKNTFLKDLQLLNYGFLIERLDTIDRIEVLIYSLDIDHKRQKEINLLLNVLQKDFPSEYKALLSAYENYASSRADSDRTTASICRNVLDQFMKKFTKNEHWKEGLKELDFNDTSVTISYNVYSYLSGVGPKSPKERDRSDAFLSLRLTEDIITAAIIKKDLIDNKL